MLDGALAAQAASSSNRGGTLQPDTARCDVAVRDPAVRLDNERVLTPGANRGAAGRRAAAGRRDSDAARTAIAASARRHWKPPASTGSNSDQPRRRSGWKTAWISAREPQLLPLREVSLDAPRIETAGGDAALTARHAAFGNYGMDTRRLQSRRLPGPGTLTADARLLELAGDADACSGMAQRRTERASRWCACAGRGRGNCARRARSRACRRSGVPRRGRCACHVCAVVSILAPVRPCDFTRNTDDARATLVGAGQSQRSRRRDIVQDGNIWAPFGQIDIQASDTLVFKDGSLTSVAAAPGSLMPFGKLADGPRPGATMLKRTNQA